MYHSQETTKSIDDALAILKQMIANARRQGAKNFEMLYTLETALTVLLELQVKGVKPDPIFRDKWDNIMGWAPRVFEDHPLLDLLRMIDREVLS